MHMLMREIATTTALAQRLGSHEVMYSVINPFDIVCADIFW